MMAVRWWESGEVSRTEGRLVGGQCWYGGEGLESGIVEGLVDCGRQVIRLLVCLVVNDGLRRRATIR